jgi:hypothetical protein
VAEKKNLEIYRGDSKTITINFSPNASMVNNGIVWFTMKNAKDDIDCNDPENQCVFQTSDVVEEVLDNDQNVIGYKAEIYMPPANTEGFDIKSYVYDIQVVGDYDDPQNPGKPALVKTLVEGKFKVLEDVTIKTS